MQHELGMNIFELRSDMVGKLDGTWTGTGDDALDYAHLRTKDQNGNVKLDMWWGDPSFVHEMPAIPEPTTLSLLTLGLFSLAGFRRKKFKK